MLKFRLVILIGGLNKKEYDIQKILVATVIRHYRNGSFLSGQRSGLHI